MRKLIIILLTLAVAINGYCQRAEIAPMIKTTWGQGNPYNLQCPVKSGVHCQTGCVATAMAQIMYYHKCPAEGFDWDNMLLNYTGSETDEHKQAVAKLMHECGVAVNMEYGITTSAAWEGDAAVALVEGYGYDEGVTEVFAFEYTAEEWEELIYTELANGRPVMYGGMPSGFTHQFICDGYKDGKFHFVMSWNFKPDGYYTFEELGYFPDSQTAIIGIMPKMTGVFNPNLNTNLNYKTIEVYRLANLSLYKVK